MNKKVYISGPISGMGREKYLERFAKAEELLRGMGYDVLNPTKLLPCRWPWLYRLMGYHLTLLYDLWQMRTCQLIYKMPGWRESPGANVESCWAYHTGVWPVPRKTHDAIDLKMAKYIDKRGDGAGIECRQKERNA